MEIKDPCPACRAGFQNECHYAWDDDNWISCGEIKFNASGEVKHAGTEDSAGADQEYDSGYVEDGYESAKDISKYKDPVSTGRKRAAQMYPISAGMVCEWAGLRHAGGGIIPIIGCVGRPASDRHHGPDKNTMNNAPANLHRICDYCHNTWHGLNDPGYGERPEHTEPFIPKGLIGTDWYEHDSVSTATNEEILSAERKRLEDR